MSESIQLTIDGRPLRVAAGTTVAAALLSAGIASRLSVQGQPRSPFCGMGICMECRVTIDGVAQQPACQRLCRPGMEVTTR